MKKILAILMVAALCFAVASCEKMEDKSQKSKKAYTKQTPRNFNVITERDEYNLPDIKGLNTVVLEALNEIGVNNIKYKVFGDYENSNDSLISVSAFIVTDSDKELIVRLMHLKLSKPGYWRCIRIYKAGSSEITYYAPGIHETVDLYDYKTGKLISKKSMTSEEHMEKTKREAEEAGKRLQKEFEHIIEKYNFEYKQE